MKFTIHEQEVKTVFHSLWHYHNMLLSSNDTPEFISMDELRDLMADILETVKTEENK